MPRIDADRRRRGPTPARSSTCRLHSATTRDVGAARRGRTREAFDPRSQKSNARDRDVERSSRGGRRRQRDEHGRRRSTPTRPPSRPAAPCSPTTSRSRRRWRLRVGRARQGLLSGATAMTRAAGPLRRGGAAGQRGTINWLAAQLHERRGRASTRSPAATPAIPRTRAARSSPGSRVALPMGARQAAERARLSLLPRTSTVDRLLPRRRSELAGRARRPQSPSVGRERALRAASDGVPELTLVASRRGTTAPETPRRHREDASSTSRSSARGSIARRATPASAERAAAGVLGERLQLHGSGPLPASRRRRAAARMRRSASRRSTPPSCPKRAEFF